MNPRSITCTACEGTAGIVQPANGDDEYYECECGETYPLQEW